MSSEVFENREDDLRTSYDKLKRKIDSQLPKSQGESRKCLVRDAERDLEECNVLIQEMEEEAKKAPPTYRLDMLSKVRQYRKDLDQLSRSISNSRQNSSRPMPSFFDEEDDFSSMEASQRARLLQGSDSLSRTSDSLSRSHRVAAETDQIGADIIDELGQQRESLLRTQDRLHGTDSNLSKSRTILLTMGKRLVTNKVILIVIILLELGCLGAVIYWKCCI